MHNQSTEISKGKGPGNRNSHVEGAPVVLRQSQPNNNHKQTKTSACYQGTMLLEPSIGFWVYGLQVTLNPIALMEQAPLMQ